MSPAGVHLLSPVTGRPLAADTAHSLRDDAGERWPVAAGIAYLRPGRDALRAEALERLDAGDELGATALLLTDQDPFAPVGPPAVEATRALAAGPRGPFRDALAALNFGPVADYFLYRTLTPTYLSGLALLQAAGRPRLVVEVACGVGQYLRDLRRVGVPSVGVDLVFAKLWLARRYFVPDDSGLPAVALVCGDAAAVPVALDGPAAAFCHDAFYFLPDKPAAAREFRRLAGAGPVLVGHAHNALVESNVAGMPQTPEQYAELFPAARFYDDAHFADALRAGAAPTQQPPAALHAAEALAWLEPGETSPWDCDLAVPPAGVPLALNPLLTDDGPRYAVRWLTPRWRAEYAAGIDYDGEPRLPAEVLAAAARGERSPAIDRLARRRVLVDAGALP